MDFKVSRYSFDRLFWDCLKQKLCVRKKIKDGESRFKTGLQELFQELINKSWLKRLLKIYRAKQDYIKNNKL